MLENIALAPYTTLQIGGPARWFADATNEAELMEAVSFARERKLPLFALGGGSNLLVSDVGFAGLVVRIAMKGIARNGEAFKVAAGEEWDGLVRLAVERDCAGVECLAGIPGTVGGTPVQNVGAYGQEVSSTIQRVRALDLESGGFVELSQRECGFSYRRSIFNTAAKGRYIVTEVEYKLAQDAAPLVAYADLRRYFENRAERPTLQEVYDAVREIRHGKGMLIVAGESDSRSAGSFFKNPVVPPEAIARIAAAVGTSLSEVPRYAAGVGMVKLPAAWLLEKAGFSKGFIMGRAGISSRHTLALINRNGATAADILALRDRIVEGVEAKFGLRLEQEPVLL